MTEPIPPKFIGNCKGLSNAEDISMEGLPMSLTCFHEPLSSLLLQGPCSLAPRCWCEHFPGLLSGTQWWKGSHRSETAASQTSSSFLVPAMQLQKEEATCVREEIETPKRYWFRATTDSKLLISKDREDTR